MRFQSIHVQDGFELSNNWYKSIKKDENENHSSTMLISIYPFFSQDGGVDSERTYIKQLVQKYQKDENGEPLFNDVDENSNEEN